MLEMFYVSGLCVSELIQLFLCNVYWELGFLWVIGKGNKECLVLVGEEVFKYLCFYLDGVWRYFSNIKLEVCYLFFFSWWGSGFSWVMVFNIVKECVCKVGIEKNVSLYIFWYSFVMYFIEGGVDFWVVQDMLGYEFILIMEIYIYLDFDFFWLIIMQFYLCNCFIEDQDLEGEQFDNF